jgi:RimJ/RimL family protein N-acetyltransferase
MPGSLFLAGQTIQLRTIEEEDTEFLQQTLNDPKVRSSLAATLPRNREQKLDWIESRGDNDGAVLLIQVGAESVGTVALNPPNEVWGVAEIAYMVAPDHWGNGYATEAVELICGYAFEERRLNKVYAAPFSTNTASCRVLEKVGFTEEGILREEAFVEGEHVDICRYGLVADEWFQE